MTKPEAAENADLLGILVSHHFAFILLSTISYAICFLLVAAK